VKDQLLRIFYKLRYQELLSLDVKLKQSNSMIKILLLVKM